MASHTSLETIEDFLAQKRIAMVGLSRDPKHFSRMLFEEFCRRGYDMIPVNPSVAEIGGKRCFARVQEILPPVESAILMTSPAVTEAVVSDCAEGGITRVWMYSASGPRAVNPRAIEFCWQHGIDVVPGECPFMFFPENGFHRIHGWVRKITGAFPRHAHAA